MRQGWDRDMCPGTPEHPSTLGGLQNLEGMSGCWGSGGVLKGVAGCSRRGWQGAVGG